MTRRRNARYRRGSAGLYVPVPPPFLPSFALYRDDGSLVSGASVGAEGNALTSWGFAGTPSGSPTVVTDSVLGARTARFKSTSSIATAAAFADILSTGPSTLLVVWRARKSNAGNYPILDSSGNGATKGYQLRAYDTNSDIFQYRVVAPRISNGTTWTKEADASITVGHFIPQKWHVSVIRLDATREDISHDGKSCYVAPRVVSWSYLTAGSGPLVIGGGPIDVAAVVGWNSFFSDANRDAITAWSGARLNADLIIPVAGDLSTITTFYGFPTMIRAPNGDLVANLFHGATEAPANANTVETSRSSSNGRSWTTPVITKQSNASVRYSDICTTVLSNGDVIQTYYGYDGSGNITHNYIRRSIDGGSTYGAEQNISFGAQWEATGSPVVEDPNNPGHLHFPTYTLEVAHTKTDAYDYQSADYGVTWPTRVRIANGDADGQNYAEPAHLFVGTELRCLLRRDTGAPVTMAQTRSTDQGATWAALVDTTMQATSAGRSWSRGASGLEIWLGRPNNYQNAAVYFRGPNAAWNAAWNNIPIAIYLDCFFGGMAYAETVETSPGVRTMMWGRNHSPTSDDIVVRTNFYEWYLTLSMPSSVSPTTKTLARNTTQQLAVTGAGDYVYAITSDTGGGCSVSAGGLFTAGNAAGTCVFTVKDLNAQLLATCTYTVT